MRVCLLEEVSETAEENLVKIEEKFGSPLKNFIESLINAKYRNFTEIFKFNLLKENKDEYKY